MLATKNQGKIRELSEFLKKSGIRAISLSEFPGVREAREDGHAFEQNAEKKARVYSKKTRSLVIADDSGLEVRALKGRPGVYSARFAGPGCTYSDNNRKLLNLMRGVSWPKRLARFVCVISAYDEGKKIATVRGECDGRIGFLQKGERGFGYDPVFLPKGSAKTYAELSSAEKNRISHRGKALQKIRRILLRYLKSSAQPSARSAAASSRTSAG